MADDWLGLLESELFGRLKSEFSSKLKTTYKITDKNFSTVGSSTTPAVFPFVYMEIEDSPEIGQTLEATGTSGIRCTVRIYITDNKTKDRAKKVAYEVRKVMKGMMFRCGLPIQNSKTDGTFEYIVQCSRGICADDPI